MNHSNKNLYNRIISGEFDESPHWKEAEEQDQLLQKEIINWKQQNPGAHELSFENWFIYRRQMYNRRIEKLKSRHQEEETKRLNKLKQELQNASLYDITDILENHEGSILDLYHKIRQINQT